MTSGAGRWPAALATTPTTARPRPTVTLVISTRGARSWAAACRHACLGAEEAVAYGGKIALRQRLLEGIDRHDHLGRSPAHGRRAVVAAGRDQDHGDHQRDRRDRRQGQGSPGQDGQPASKVAHGGLIPRMVACARPLGASPRLRNNRRMEGSVPDSVGTAASWLRCYRCWSQNLEVQVHYEGVLKVDPDTGEAVEPVEEVQEAVVQCLDCLHDQPHLNLAFYEENGRRISRIEAVEDRWERMIAGTPWVASCTVTVDAEHVESCSGPEAADSLAFGAFGDHGTREFFTHVRFHKHDGDQIVIHMLVELYARSAEEAGEVLEEAARGPLSITSLAEESRPPAAAASPEDPH
jgi:hypothetical protein